ncbi:MAG: hypothetical protein LBB22_00930 [Treponema sp.]|nr:hypothetical protein [Treponema sp.]
MKKATVIFMSLLLSCEGFSQPPPNEKITPEISVIDLVQEIVARLGPQELPTPEVPTGTEGGTPPIFTEEDKGQIVNCEYVCGYINQNQKWGLSIAPVPGTEKQVANMEYVLRMVDLANKKLGGATAYGTGAYATKQAADTVAVNACMSLITWNVKWVMIGNAIQGTNQAAVAYSSDGSTWDRVMMSKVISGSGSVGEFTGIAYGDGMWVTTRQQGIYSSTNGIYWTGTPPPKSNSWFDVIYADNKFVAVGYDVIGYSTDGMSWTICNVDSFSAWESVAYGNGRWVAVGDTDVAISTDGINWRTRHYIDNYPPKSVTFGNGMFVGYRPYNHIYYSTDGEAWVESELPDNDLYISDITYGNGLFAVSAHNKIATSTDMVNWRIKIYPDSFYSNCLTYGDKWVSGAVDIYSSADNNFDTWSIEYSQPLGPETKAEWRDICYKQ